ncbi:MAG TPA: alpha/beta hydrolase [Candidatus Binataceae bacterium]|nr:alpha/beta hydrolase [Candidatus Binataceae bacterium]
MADGIWKTLPPTPTLPRPERSGYAPVNGIQMWYAEFGAGPPVLLLHGGLVNSNWWGNQVPFLVSHHFMVIVTDSRGHGRSTRTSAPYSYDLMASDVVALLDYLKLKRVALVGWSDGGIIGLDIAIHHPERLDRLFAFGANTDPAGLNANFDQNPVFAAAIKRGGPEYRKLSRTPDQYDAFVQQISRMWATQPHFTDKQLASITTPTTIADGEYDEAIKQSHDRYMAHAIPNAKLVILPNVSHFAMLQNSAEFNSAMLTALTAK